MNNILDHITIKSLWNVTLTLNMLTTTIVAPFSNASKWQMGFNSAFGGLMWAEGESTVKE